MIKHDNIIYIKDIAPIGGVETYVYELVKKYSNNDIAVVCRSISPVQKKRLQKYCMVYVFKDEPIVCNVAIINWDVSIIDYITKDIWKENLKPGDPRGIYQGVHADYTHPAMGKLPQDPRIKQYLCITIDQMNKFPLMTKAKNYSLCRNPYTLEDKGRPLIIVSPTRLTNEKGVDLMYDLSNALDNINDNYLWFIPTTKEYTYQSIFSKSNVIYVKNRLDVEKFLSLADWVVLPSKSEGDSYTIKEALYRGIPIVARHLNYFDEYDIKDGINALFINEDNVEEVAKKMQQPLKFEFKPIEDGYDKIIWKGKSRYEEERKMKVRVRCVKKYLDVELGIEITPDKSDKNYERTISRERADEIIERTDGAVEIIGTVKEEEIETATLPADKETAVVNTKVQNNKKKAKK